MKGTFFSKPLEFNLAIHGETWAQGANIKGSLGITNHGADSIDLKEIGCHLCYCSNKKFKLKDASSIALIESVMLEQDHNEVNFEFTLKNDCPITDSSGSLYILCGNLASPFEGGFLQLNITPMTPILHFVEILELFYRFKVKNLKNKKDSIEATVIAPDSKEWASIQKMTLSLKMQGDELEAKFDAKLKRLSFEVGVNKTKDEKREITKVLTKKQYDLYGSAHQDGIKKVIEEVLAQMRVKSL